MGSMKMHQLARGLIWEHEPFLTLGCKRLRPLAPKLNPTADTTSSVPFDLKSFIKPESGPRKLPSSSSQDDINNKKHPPPPSPHGQQQVETQPGGTRWNPTQEQIGILEMLYKGGMRTPNAEQIEQITAQLSKYGKIEGKNVFYWFQNHKARERQKQKRNNTTPSLHTITTGQLEDHETPYNKKCRRWGFQSLEYHQNRAASCKEEQQQTTLELFPLHPEGR